MIDDDAPHPSGRDRYALYTLRYEHGEEVHHRLCETSREGIGLALETMIKEGEIQRGDSVGLFDRESRDWLINPWLALK